MLTSPSEFKTFLNLTDKEIEEAEKVVKFYPVRATEYYLSLASKEEIPIKRTVFPSIRELNQKVKDDPLEEENLSPVKHLTHKYKDRALLVITNSCPVLCRFCMRKRNWKKRPFTIDEKEIDEAVRYIREKKIRDVLISGGEPLTVDTTVLEAVLMKLKEIDTVEIIRVGSRLPVVAPERLNQKILKILEKAEKVWLNTHFNHPVEITKYSKNAVEKLLKSGIPVNNQTVLLKGINDNEETLYTLFSKLQGIKVRPYYLFRCDPVKGVFHFATSIEKGLKIMRNLKKRLSPLALPYFAVDTPKGKIILFPEGKIFKKENKTYIFKVGRHTVRLPV